ncbi:ribonuclease P protein component [Luteimonas sp. RD2P54]|uniref:Ribonuclease P protein component n=1 Tax=Luteimonas endophytica TaxID=3042023 RepID=A0ABT6J788_9GAMM|nr:ribonuclease P protein component [Luteimonas endophytica]MDH5822604.1 ribonuclease P protein component [Luteimonas endophytica]
MTARFPRQARVRARADFDRVFKQGRRTAAPLLALHWLDDGAPPRLGLAVSRKVDATAVGRNRIKRALREQFRALRPRLRPGAYVVVARPAAANTASALLRAAMVSVLARAAALPPPPPGGTMPGASSACDPIPAPTPAASGE